MCNNDDLSPKFFLLEKFVEKRSFGISQNLNQNENFIESNGSLRERERKEKKKIPKVSLYTFLIYNIFLPFFSSILRNNEIKLKRAKLSRIHRAIRIFYAPIF